MITARTVFILGAGASAPYGFSTGKKQLDDARVQDERHIAAAISPVSPSCAGPLLEQLKGTGEYSIDAMLAADSPWLPAAKAYIARDLFNVERDNRTPRAEPPGYWYRTLFSNIPRRAVEEARGAPLRIFTFNYDRSLDLFLWDAFHQRFPAATAADLSGLLGTLGPFHLHGDLGFLNPDMARGGGVVPYGGSDPRGPTQADMETAISRIRLISETRETDAAFVSLHQELTLAAQVVFLGFGFHEDNIGKLRIPQNVARQTQIYASAMGLTEQQMMSYRSKYQFPNLSYGYEDDGVARYLAKVPRILG